MSLKSDCYLVRFVHTLHPCPLTHSDERSVALRESSRVSSPPSLFQSPITPHTHFAFPHPPICSAAKMQDKDVAVAQRAQRTAAEENTHTQMDKTQRIFKTKSGKQLLQICEEKNKTAHRCTRCDQKCQTPLWLRRNVA